MATVQGMTLARALAMEAANVVDGYIDGSGHLILVHGDASETDAGDASVSIVDASTTQAGKVELATTTETTTGTDTVRAVTPAGVAAAISAAAVPSASTTVQGKVELATNVETTTGTDTVRAVTPAGVAAAIAAIPGSTVKAFTAPAESAAQSVYPIGVSYSTVSSGSGWTPNGGAGTILTVNSSADRCYQMFYSNAGGSQTPEVYMRTHHSTGGGGGWTAWQQLSRKAYVDSLDTAMDARVDVLEARKIVTGHTSVAVSAASSKVQSVSFGTTFPSTPRIPNPNITSAPGATSGWACRAINITTTGFDLFLFGASSTFTVDVDWIATTP